MIVINVTDDIILKQIELSDASDIFATINGQREYLGKWLPFVALTKEITDTEKFISTTLELPEENREYIFVIRYHNTFAGIVGYRDTDKLNKKTELGYWLSEPFQGKGIIIQSVKELLKFTFLKMEMNRLQIRCAAENERSKQIPKKLHFSYEGIERAGEQLSDGTFVDLEVFSLLRNDYLKMVEEQN